MNASTQEGRLLRHLKKHRSITPPQAAQIYGIYRFSARIKNLRDEGWIINTVHLHDKLYRYEFVGHRDEPEPTKPQGVLERLRARFLG